jgi:hypothetical protein
MAVAISIRITVTVVSISLSLRLGISRPLAKTLGGPGLEGGSGGVGSNTGEGTIAIRESVAVGIRIAVVAIESRSIGLRLSISGPPDPAPEASGGEAGGRDSGPVRVGVVEGGVGWVVGPIEVAGVSLSIRGGEAPGQQDTQNLEIRTSIKHKFKEICNPFSEL